MQSSLGKFASSPPLESTIGGRPPKAVLLVRLLLVQEREFGLPVQTAATAAQTTFNVIQPSTPGQLVTHSFKR